MSIKSKVFAAAATLTLVAGAGAVAATSASAATPSAGPNAVDIFNHDFGTHAHPNFVLDTYRQGEKVGQPQILFRVANSDPAEDYTYSYQGLTSDFFAAGLVSAAVNLHYGNGSATAVMTTRRSRSSTRLTAWTAACALVSPPPPSRARVSRCSRVASLPRPCGSWTRSTPWPTGTSR